MAFVAVSVFTLAAAPLALLMPRDAGNDLTGRTQVAPPDLQRPQAAAD